MNTKVIEALRFVYKIVAGGAEAGRWRGGQIQVPFLLYSTQDTTECGSGEMADTPS
ncbi:MAG: hypothetical protein WBD10_07685 [Acidobacteriaceae bacterium]